MAETTAATSCVLPQLPAKLDRLWETVIDLGQALTSDSWMLVGGQMVMLRGLLAGRAMTRATNDIDVLAALLVPPARPKLNDCVRTVRELGFNPLEANEPDLLHRFVHPDDGAIIDILAPDHQSWPPIIKQPRSTVRIDGGTQALQRAEIVNVTKASRTVGIAIPSLLGALILKAAFKAENRLPERHATDAAFLASLITDPISIKAQMKGSDYGRILFLDKELTDPEHAAWMTLGEYREDALAVWRILRQPPPNR